MPGQAVEMDEEPKGMDEEANEMDEEANEMDKEANEMDEEAFEIAQREDIDRQAGNPVKDLLGDGLDLVEDKLIEKGGEGVDKLASMAKNTKLGKTFGKQIDGVAAGVKKVGGKVVNTAKKVVNKLGGT